MHNSCPSTAFPFHPNLGGLLAYRDPMSVPDATVVNHTYRDFITEAVAFDFSNSASIFSSTPQRPL
jgi:hypothetical protein